jgi:rhodanese-related sulfurtransferase
MRTSNDESTRHQYARRFLLTCLALAFLPILSPMVVAAGNEPNRPAIPGKARTVSHPYCGVYCIYAALKLGGQDLDIDGLLRPEYIGSPQGSTLQELQKAVEEHGFHALAVGKLTSRELRHCPHPVVLHVKLNAASKSYDHYELFLGTRNGKAKLFDPPNSRALVPFHELAPRWDGIGLILSPQPIDLRAIMAPARRRAACYSVITLAAILAVRWVRRSLPGARPGARGKGRVLSVVQGIGLVTIAPVWGIGYHYIHPEGFLAHAGATRSVQQAHAGHFIPKVSCRAVRRLLQGDAVFIDARVARDFAAGHLDGAINLPVDANEVEYGRTTAHIAKDARIILYCQSSVCRYAERMAIRLTQDNYSKVSIFKGGWVEWVAGHSRKEEARAGN